MVIFPFRAVAVVVMDDVALVLVAGLKAILRCPDALPWSCLGQKLQYLCLIFGLSSQSSGLRCLGLPWSPGSVLGLGLEGLTQITVCNATLH